jgi:hypothetical protein
MADSPVCGREDDGPFQFDGKEEGLIELLLGITG